jgi:hypothetical protein
MWCSDISERHKVAPGSPSTEGGKDGSTGFLATTKLDGFMCVLLLARMFLLNIGKGLPGRGSAWAPIFFYSFPPGGFASYSPAARRNAVSPCYCAAAAWRDRAT